MLGSIATAAPPAAGLAGSTMRRTRLSVSRTDSPLLHHHRRDFDLLAPLRQAEQRPRMTHFQLALLQPFADFGRQLQQAQQIADRGARAPDGVGGLLMGEPEFGDQALQSARLLPAG